MCVNFKELNKITVFDPEPMMSPDDIFLKLSGSQIYSTFDFSKGYWAIPMEEKSKDVTTFVYGYVTWLNEILCDAIWHGEFWIYL